MQQTKNYITAHDFYRKVAKNSEGDYLIHEVQDILNLISQTLQEVVIKDKVEVRLPGFGTFFPKEIQGRSSTSPLTGESYSTEGYTSMSFKLSDTARAAARGKVQS